MYLEENYNELPINVQQLLDKFNESNNSYSDCKELVSSLNSIGYTMDYGLDAVPYNLRCNAISLEGAIREIKDKDVIDWINDGNVVLIGGTFRTQDAQYKNRIKSVEGLISYFNREFIG